MAVIKITLAALMLACAACSSHTPLSDRNQYEAHEDGPDSTQLLHEATDLPLTVHMPHRFDVSKSKLEAERPSVPELQVGCEEALIKTEKSTLRHKRDAEDNRKRRSYFPWTSSFLNGHPSQRFTSLQPQTYHITRPYYIPIWGAPGRIPIYFPPQPVYHNPGYPPHNRPNGYLPPTNGYLPPDPRKTTQLPETTTVYTANRFDDGPVWDVEESPDNQVVQRPALTSTTSERPTRRRRPERPTSTHPPLVHKASDRVPNNLSPVFSEPEAALPPQAFLTTTAPSLIAERPSTRRPSTRRPAATSRPANDASANRQPSTCVWAIIKCCSGTTTDVSYTCFEQNGCMGAFWDASPCDSDFARAAVSSAMNYFSK